MKFVCKGSLRNAEDETMGRSINLGMGGGLKAISSIFSTTNAGHSSVEGASILGDGGGGGGESGGLLPWKILKIEHSKRPFPTF